MNQTDFQTIAREMAGKHGFGQSAVLAATTGLVVLALLWASLAELDNVTRGEGRIVSSLQNQMVQSAEGGVILRRYVSENSAVKNGDILFEIDPVDAESELNRLMQRKAAMEIKEARLEAEIAGQEFVLSADLRAQSPMVATTEENLFAARRAELAGALAVLEQKKNQREQDLQGAETNRRTTESTMKLLEREIAVLEPMVKDNIAPETRLLELQRELEAVRGQFDNAAVAIQQAKSGIAEIQNEIENRGDAYLLEAMDQLSAVVAEKSELLEALPLLQERVSRTVIRAPMDGVVNQLNYRTTGGYVKPGDVVLELVPTGEDLVIAAEIDPKDISNIRPDDAVRIRLSAYDSAKYGTVDGRVLRISPDALTRENGSTYYQVDVTLEGTITLADGSAVVYKPGMTATVDVLSGKRTVLEYIWQPVSKVQELALRD